MIYIISLNDNIVWPSLLFLNLCSFPKNSYSQQQPFKMAKVISDIEKLTFQVLTKTFFYLWPYPVKWNSVFTKVELMEPFRKLLPFAISISIISSFGLMACATCILISKSNNRFECVMLMIVGIAVLTITSTQYLCYKYFSGI